MIEWKEPSMSQRAGSSLHGMALAVSSVLVSPVLALGSSIGSGVFGVTTSVSGVVSGVVSSGVPTGPTDAAPARPRAGVTPRQLLIRRVLTMPSLSARNTSISSPAESSASVSPAARADASTSIWETRQTEFAKDEGS